MRKSILFGVVAAVVMASSSAAMADTRWERHHPRRDQVNDRLERQNHRINHEYREGELTRGQARELHREDRAIRRQERFFAAHHNGHITRAERSVLNHEENGVSHQIGR